MIDEKWKGLFLNQKKTLDTFIETGGITKRYIDMRWPKSNYEECIFKNGVSLSKLSDEDFSEFIKGVEDRELRIMYGFPKEMNKENERSIFDQFCHLPRAYSIDFDGNSVGFLLDVEP